MEAAEALVAHAKRTGAVLIYDLDDDLTNIPANHPDAAVLRPRARVVRRMLEKADAVWLSTEGLRQALVGIRPDAELIENRLDERIWVDPPPALGFRDDPIRILCMGTSTHNRDFALIEPALTRLKDEFGDRLVIDVLGMTSAPEIAPGLTRIAPPAQAGRSYPGFVNWLTSAHPRWHIGLAPLADTPFNRANHRSRPWIMRRWGWRCWRLTCRFTRAHWPMASAGAWCGMIRARGMPRSTG